MTPEAKAREIAVRNCPMQCDLPFSEMGKAVWTLGLQDEIERAIREAEQSALERAAKVAENSVHQKCCGRWQIVCDARGETASEECCGNPDIEPMYPNEIAQSIRDLGKQKA